MVKGYATHSLYYYMHGILHMLIAVLVIEIGWRMAGGHIIFGFLGSSHAISFPWIIRALAFIVIGWRFVFQLHDMPKNAAKAGALAGILIGLIIGLFEVMWYHNLSAWLSLFALPWQTLIAGATISWGAAHLFLLWKEERAEYFKKER